MELFKHELVDNLADRIKANSSIAYASAICKMPGNKATFSKAAIDDSDHLYRFYSVLVSTCVNENTDVFGPEEVWKARSSPTHKPVNLNHEEKEIVGHITDVWPVDTDYNEIAAPIDFYHLLIGQCIYKKWSDEETQAKFDELIKKVDTGELYVSMECYFKNIAYYITTPDKSNYVVARNEESSFLTKHLRAYGGTGFYKDYKVDRFLVDLSFSAVGIVENPANKYSVIFPSSDIKKIGKAKKIDDFNHVLAERGVYSSSNNYGEKIMADVTADKLENEVKELKAALEVALKKNEEFETKAFKAAQEKHTIEVTELNSKLSASAKDVEDTKKLVETSAKELAGVKEDLVKVTKAKTEVEDKLAKIEAEQLKTKRVAKLVEGGMAKDKAESTVGKFSYLNDEQFDEVSETLAEKEKKKDKKEEDKDKDMADKNADASVLDNLDKKKDAALSTDNKDDAADKTETHRKALSSLLKFNKNKNTKKK